MFSCELISHLAISMPCLISLNVCCKDYFEDCTVILGCFHVLCFGPNEWLSHYQPYHINRQTKICISLKKLLTFWYTGLPTETNNTKNDKLTMRLAIVCSTVIPVTIVIICFIVLIKRRRRERPLDSFQL